MEVFGAWLFIIGLSLIPITLLIYIILDLKYTDDFIIRNSIFDIGVLCIFLEWVCIIGGMLLVYFF